MVKQKNFKEISEKNAYSLNAYRINAVLIVVIKLTDKDLYDFLFKHLGEVGII